MKMAIQDFQVVLRPSLPKGFGIRFKIAIFLIELGARISRQTISVEVDYE